MAEKRYENNYRFKESFIKKWTNVLVAIMLSGIGAFMVLLIIGLIVFGDVPTDEVPDWIVLLGGLFAFIGFVIPLVMGAILGGLAIHKFGWIPLLMVILGMFAFVFAQSTPLPWLTPYCVASMIIGVVGIFALGISSKVPIWLQLPIIQSPRLYLQGKPAKTKKKTTKK